MKRLFATGIVLFLGMSAVISASSAYADNVTVQVTASNLVSNIPQEFTTRQFALLRPWELEMPPAFQISPTPTTDNLSVNPLNNLPALEIIDHTPPNNGLTWFYYCNGLTFNYSQSTHTATVVFSGKIDSQSPGSGVQCTCSGSACSTTATVPAKFMLS